MTSGIVKAVNLLVLLAGLAILFAASRANPHLFDFGTHAVLKIWMTLLFIYLAFSGLYKLLIILNKFYPILALGSLVTLMLWLLMLGLNLFVNVPKTGNSGGGVFWVIFVMIGWLLWDINMLYINSFAYEKDKEGDNQR